MAKSFVRLDKLLVDKGLVPSRERAQALILAAKVLSNGQKITKAGTKVPEDSHIELLADEFPYVSRGGAKLRHAIEFFGLTVAGLVALDVGASTGGFTDCLLQYGAKKVYAVDVGYGQLDWRLRNDPRVICLERQNIRYLERKAVPESIQIATIDTSFISLRIVIPAVLPFLSENATLVALIKPQFEAGRANVGKGGIVKDPQVHKDVCESLGKFCESLRLSIIGITTSPLLGAKGNKEFLLAAET